MNDLGELRALQVTLDGPAAKASELDKQIAILTAEAEVAKLDFELQVLDEKDEEDEE